MAGLVEGASVGKTAHGASVNFALGVECADVSAASISNWYPLHRGKTFRTKFVALTPEFVAFLGSDGPCVLPTTSKGARVASRGQTAVDDDCELTEDEDEDGPAAPAPSFPDEEAAIDEAIVELADQLHGNSALTALSLSSNKMTDEGAIAIAGAGDPIFAPVMWRTRFWIFHSESDDQAADAVRCPPVRALLPRGAAYDLRCISPRVLMSPRRCARGPRSTSRYATKTATRLYSNSVWRRRRGRRAARWIESRR